MIVSCILIPILSSYAATNDKNAENQTAGSAKGSRLVVASKPDTSRDVSQIQTLLTLLKFDPGPIDGILGKQTTKAIRAFQLDIGVPVTGKIDANLKSQLDQAYRRSILRAKEETEDDGEKPQVVKGKPIVTLSQDVKLFSEPDLEGILVGEAKQGTQFTAMCRTGQWFWVTTQDDRQSWVHESWMTIASQAFKEVKALVDCDSMRALKLLAEKRAKELEAEKKPAEEPATGKTPDVNQPKETELKPQKEPTSTELTLKTENQYLKYIKISFPIAAVIFLAFFYRIWTRRHGKKRDEKIPSKIGPKAEISANGEPAEEYIELLEEQALEKELPDQGGPKAEVDRQDPANYQDPSHPGFITPVVRRKVWTRNKGQCAGCGGRKDLQYDYIVPLSEGGNKTIDNLQLLCRACSQEQTVKHN
jgi:hypothetical protein